MDKINKWLDAAQAAHDFLRDNMQYGDDWEEECVALEDLITTLHANAEAVAAAVGGGEA